MARRSGSNDFNPLEPFPYIPDIDDAREDEEDPFYVEMTCATHDDMRALDESEMMRTMQSKGKSAAVKAVKRLSARREALVAKHVVAVYNYEVQNLKTREWSAPTTGEELVEALKYANPTEAEMVIADLSEAIENAAKAEVGFRIASKLISRP